MASAFRCHHNTHPLSLIPPGQRQQYEIVWRTEQTANDDELISHIIVGFNICIIIFSRTRETFSFREWLGSHLPFAFVSKGRRESCRIDKNDAALSGCLRWVNDKSCQCWWLQDFTSNFYWLVAMSEWHIWCDVTSFFHIIWESSVCKLSVWTNV